MGMSESPPSHPRPRELEAFVAGEPSPGVEAHLQGCVACRHRATLLEQDREHHLARLPAAVFLAQVATRRREHAARARRRNVVLATIASGLGVATAAAAGLAIVPGGPGGPTGLSGPTQPSTPVAPGGPSEASEPSEPSAADDTRMKGTAIQIFRKRGEQVMPVGDGDRIRAGDGLRIALTLERPDRVSVWFVDRTGRIDPYPGTDPGAALGTDPGPEQGALASGDRPTSLAAGYTLLPGGVVVDAPCVDMRLIVQTSAGQLERALRCE
jgi:hypothetical protein